MRNSSGVLQSAQVTRVGPITAGGYVTGIRIADDDTKIIRLDTQNACYRGPAHTKWQKFFRPGPTVGVGGCNILASDIYFDPAGQGLGSYTWGRTGSRDVAICATNSNVMICHSMFYLYGTLDGAATVFKFTNFPQITSNGMNPNDQSDTAWNGSRTRGSSCEIDPNNPDHAMIDTPDGWYRTTNLTAGASATWTLIPSSTLPIRGAVSQRNLIAFDRSSALVSGRTGKIYVFANSETYAIGTAVLPTITVGNSFSINGTTVTMTGTTATQAVADINAAAITNIRAISNNSGVTIANATGGAITLANVSGTPLTTLGLASVAANAGGLGPGLFVSSDGGGSWVPVGGTGKPTTAGYLNVHPTTGIVYVTGTANGATQGQMYRLVPSGPTWTQPAGASAVRSVVFSSQSATRHYAFSSAGSMYLSNDSGVTWGLTPTSTGNFNRSAPKDLWHEYTASGVSLGDVVASPIQDRLYMAEGLGTWYCDNPPTTTSATPTWNAYVEGYGNLVGMGCQFTSKGDLLVAGQDKPGWVITKGELDARTNAKRYVPSPTSLRYAQSMDWAKSDPNFLCFAYGHGTKQWTKSPDRGVTWFDMAQPAASLVYGNVLALTPLNMLWIPGANSGQLHLTQDGGATPPTPLTLTGNAWSRWHNAYNFARRCGLALEDGSGYVVYCHGVKLDNSTDTTALGFWFISPTGTVTRLSNASVSIPTTNQGLDFYDGKLKEPPDHHGDFFWTGGNNGTGLYKSTNLLTAGVGSVTWTKLGPGTGFSEVFSFGFGAPAVPGDYPIVRCAAWGNDGSGSRYGFWDSYDGGSTWTYVAMFPNFNYDLILDIAGDRNIYGRWAYANSGSSVDVVDAELVGRPTVGLRFH